MRLLWVLLGVCVLLLVFVFASWRTRPTGVVVVPPSATTSSEQVVTPSPNNYEGWSRYSNAGYEIAFMYPSEWGEPIIGEAAGTSGKSLSGRFSNLESIFFRAVTSDYTNPTGAQLASSGCILTPSGKYSCGFAKDKAYTVTPDLIYASKDDQEILVVYNQEWPQLLQPGTRAAFINLSGQTYKGIAFAYQDIPENEVVNFDLLVKSVTALK